MIIFLKVVLYILYDFFRYNINLLTKKKHNYNHFEILNKLNKKILNQEKIKEKKILVASFVHQYGYIYTECLIANHLSNILNAKIYGLMDKNDKITENFFNSFNFSENFFIIKNNLFLSIVNLKKTFNIFSKFQNLNDLINFKYKGLDFGKIIYDHYIRNSSNPSPDQLNFKFLYFLNESILVYSQVEKIFHKNKFDYMVMSERQFIPSMIIFQMALLKKIKIIGRVAGPKKIGVYMYKSKNQKFFADIQVNKALIDKYENSKNCKNYISKGSRLVKSILYEKKRNFDHNIKSKKNEKSINLSKKKFFELLNLDKRNPTCFVFSHNLLDGNLQGKSVFIFKDYLSWLRETLMYLEKLDNKVNWIIKEHPSNYGFSKMKTNLVKEYKNIIKTKRKNIKIFPDNFNRAIIPKIANAVVTLGGTAGLEYACLKIPCITSAGIYYSGKGFTIEYKSKSQYKFYLKNLNKIIHKSKNKLKSNKAIINYYTIFEILRFDHPLLFDFDITRKMNENNFMRQIFKLNKKIDLNNYYKFEKYLKYQIDNNKIHFINADKT